MPRSGRENGQQRGAEGPKSAARARTQPRLLPDTVKFLVKLFSKRLRGTGWNPAVPRSGRENGQQRGAEGPESAAGARTQPRLLPGTIKFLAKLFSKSLRGWGQSPLSAAKRQGKRPAERGRRPRICVGSAHTAPAPAGHSKVFGQAFFKKLAGGGGQSPLSAVKRQGKQPAERGPKAPNPRRERAHSPGSCPAQ